MKLFPALLALVLTFPLIGPRAAFADAYFASPSIPTEVQAAHDAFLTRDFDRMGKHIQAALIAHPGDAAIQADLLDLFEKAYQVGGDGAVTPEWKFPKEIEWANVTVKKKYVARNGSVRWRLSMSVDYPKGQKVEQLRIIRHHPNRVLVDMKAGVGEFETEEADERLEDLWVTSGFEREQIQPGLYLFTIQMKGGEPMQGWFLLTRNMAAGDSPEVQAPRVNQVFTTGTPTFAWQDYYSDRYRPLEKRKVALAVVRPEQITTGNTWHVAKDAPFTAATLGSTEGELGLKQLPPDNYVFQVKCRERHRFGELRINRESATDVHFSVKN